MFPSVSPKQSFPALESEVLAYWKANNTFKRSIETRPEDNPYRFYDGPPFITGMPHYGSLLSSIVKDVVGRYATMRGRRVDRTWGWDCHGLPIEEKVQKKLGLKSNADIEAGGVKKFIDECYAYTSEVSSEWNWYVDKIGRWVDMDNAYRTMDQDYMESVMWVFSELWKKGLIYEGKRVSLYSWKLGTPISNFEVAMDDTYQEVNDPAITVKFKIPERDAAIGWVLDENERFLMGWSNKYNGWHLVGGAVDEGESIEDCIVREVYEEIGIVLDKKGLEQIAQESQLDQGELWRATHFKVHTQSDSIKNGEPEKFREWKWFTKDELIAIYDEIYEVDKLVVDMFLGRAPIEKKAPPVSVLAWTTTPWTIPANMALAVRNDIDYVLASLAPPPPKGESEGVTQKGILNSETPPNLPLSREGGAAEQYIVAKNRLETVFKGKGEYTVIRELKGSELVGLGYVPPFPEYYYQKHGDQNHKIYHADFITDTDGTGIGHEAPEFGEVDFQLAKKEGIHISHAMDDAGRYTDEIHDYEGTHYLDLENPENGANKINIERMKANNTLFKLEGITHRVPFCPRSGTPLMQKAQKSWFIDIQSQKDKLIEANEQINWFPEYLKEGRFKKGIETAPDWCISRTRYWGAPMPVWMGADGEKMVVSSREEIYEANKSYGQLTKLIVTRHAESEANVAKHYDDIGTSPLSPKGREQAESLVQELKNKGVDVIITSPFVRAIQTAEPLAKELGIEAVTMDELRETDHGKFQNADNTLPEVAECMATFRKNISMGENRDFKFGETGESYSDIAHRMQVVIDTICRKYPGKTVFVVSHGYPTRILQELLTSKIDSKNIKNADTRTFILDGTNKNLLNLHKPYIDSILLQNPKATKTKKVLGVHGFRRTEKVIDFFAQTSKNLQEEGIEIFCPLFEEGETVNYENWRKIFLESIDGVDTIFAHSLGCRFSLDMIIQNKILLKRLILVAPPEGKHERLQEFFAHLNKDISQIKNYVDEVIVLYSTDDTEGRVEASKRVIEETGAFAIKMENYGHFNIAECKLIEGLVRYGAPMTRIPEVLDVWMDSGSMPYAQMHYPFENKEAMQASFPADFIAEYVGQLRAWFYVMHVLGVLLNPTNQEKPTPSFTNVITTGVVNGNDGRKMSKSFGNYPDPRMAIEKYGADPIRFYMLNSPLLSGGDMDFKEEGIMETIKGVMLPIWNTYSFFTTYANIDAWEHDETEVWFSRHAESTSNIAGKMSDGNDNPELTEKGREQAKNAGETLRAQGKKFDVIIHTGLIRTVETARIIGEETGFSGEYIVDTRLIEQSAGEYAGKTLDEIAKMGNIKDSNPENHDAIRKIYKNNSTEDIAQFDERILTAYADILTSYRGKKVLIVGHAGTSRPVISQYFGKGTQGGHFGFSIANADPYRLMTTPIVNPLDQWILSKLQVLIGQVHDAMEGYDVSRGCRQVVDYMDELTNWYVRLSRRRFWESGMTADKQSAYETLYTVLTEVSKLLAPLMPFLSENIYQGLTGRESVHLEYITLPNKHLVANDLNRDMEICEHIVSLGLALRSRKNIRVRQPLTSVTITRELSDYYKQIIRDELNVKEVRYENPDNLAKKICKPDARKIGPKYGKDVQKVITEAKNGNFVEKENGIIDVGGFILELGEYTMEYLPLEGTLDVEGGYGMVVALDTTITEALKLEGYARDIIRLIQDMRKDADYQVTDRITLHIYGAMHAEILAGYGDMIQSETLSTLAPLMVGPDVQKDIEIEPGITLTVQIER